MSVCFDTFHPCSCSRRYGILVPVRTAVQLYNSRDGTSCNPTAVGILGHSVQSNDHTVCMPYRYMRVYTYMWVPRQYHFHIGSTAVVSTLLEYMYRYYCALIVHVLVPEYRSTGTPSLVRDVIDVGEGARRDPEDEAVRGVGARHGAAWHHVSAASSSSSAAARKFARRWHCAGCALVSDQ